MANWKRDLKGHTARYRAGLKGSSGKAIIREAPRKEYQVEVTEVQIVALRNLERHCERQEGRVTPEMVPVPMRTWKILERKGLVDKMGRLSIAGRVVLTREVL